MSSNGTLAVTCPTEPGLRAQDGFNPSFDFTNVLSDPTANWHIIGWLVSAGLCLITWIVSLIGISRHLRNYYDPEIQRHKVRILLYPPIYATLSFVQYLRPDYSTTIGFFATLFEALAVYNLYICLQALLEPFYKEANGRKEPYATKVMGIWKLNLKSKWGMHYRIITDIMVFQFPIWSMVDAFISIFAELKGRYCAEIYSVKGAYLWLTVINFASLSIILTALFTYLAVFGPEYKRGHIPSHGMFWCVKGPIMIIFYLGEILLSLLVTFHVIKGTDGSSSHDGTPWTAQAVRFGIYVLLVCVVMTVVSILMLKYFGVKSTQHRIMDDTIYLDRSNKMTVWQAIVDSLFKFIPELFGNILCCGVDSFKLARKRVEMRGRQQREMQMEGEDGHPMFPVTQDDGSQPLNSGPTAEPPYNTYMPSQSNNSYDGYSNNNNGQNAYPSSAPSNNAYRPYTDQHNAQNTYAPSAPSADGYGYPEHKAAYNKL
ncbi:organic solute transporter Ostalpha-domain-containing protein [Umbelopsis sp. AD052]|nr:organic solute transporter Ostalpha-domain-containing protein [Umbelopsis sp. AD052]